MHLSYLFIYYSMSDVSEIQLFTVKILPVYGLLNEHYS